MQLFNEVIREREREWASFISPPSWISGLASVCIDTSSCAKRQCREPDKSKYYLLYMFTGFIISLQMQIRSALLLLLYYLMLTEPVHLKLTYVWVR